MTADQFDALAELMRLRTGSASHAASRLMLVNGKTASAAAAEVGMSYTEAWKARVRAERMLVLAAKALGR